MLLSDYLIGRLNIKEDLCIKDIKEALEAVNADIEIDLNPWLVKVSYLEFSWHDASVIASILENSRQIWIAELKAMREYILADGSFSVLSHERLPETLKYKGLEAVRENIDPWISQIAWIEYEIEKFKKVPEYHCCKKIDKEKI